jgi:predicted NodU family carbamoyl transferase
MSKKTIKVIKKEQRNGRKTTAQPATGPRETAREMVKTVTNWVNEFQQKRRTETADAVKSLLAESPRPSEI